MIVLISLLCGQPSVKCNYRAKLQYWLCCRSRLLHFQISIEVAHVQIKHTNLPCFIKGPNMSKQKKKHRMFCRGKLFPPSYILKIMLFSFLNQFVAYKLTPWYDTIWSIWQIHLHYITFNCSALNYIAISKFCFWIFVLSDGICQNLHSVYSLNKSKMSKLHSD